MATITSVIGALIAGAGKEPLPDSRIPELQQNWELHAAVTSRTTAVARHRVVSLWHFEEPISERFSIRS